MHSRFLPRLLLRAALGLGLAASFATAAQAQKARSEVTPYLEVEQVLSADLDGGDTLTYTAIAAGVDARVATNRVQAQVSYRYEHRIPWDGDMVDESIHSGLAQVSAKVIDDAVSVDAGAIAARSRIDPRGAAPGFSTSDSENVAEVYGAYAGPSLATRVGAVDVSANYRLGYVKVGDGERIALAPGEPVLDRYDSSVSHSAFVSAGMAPGELPVGVTVTAGYGREDTEQLDQEFEGHYARGDVVLPISPHLAVTAGAGYEEIKISQQDIARNSDGSPVVTPDGELVGDPSKPRLLAYDTSGLIWDAGVIWRPTRRTELQARIGKRYGGMTYTGSLRHRLGANLALSAVVYDSVTSFGRLLVSDLDGLPGNFEVDRNSLNPGLGGIGGCVFGSDAGTGGCFDDVFQSITTSNFRNRGATFLLSGERGRWDFGVGVGYNNRRYLAARNGAGFSLDGVTDESLIVAANASRQLSRSSELALDAYTGWFDSGLPGGDTVTSTGFTGSYHRSFLLDRLQAQAALGVSTSDTGEFDSTIASALLGLRYNF